MKSKNVTSNVTSHRHMSIFLSKQQTISIWLKTIRGVTRHLSHETRRDTRLGSRERDEIFFMTDLYDSTNCKLTVMR